MKDKRIKSTEGEDVPRYKGVMSSCGSAIIFHVDDCNSDNLERTSLEKPAQCITKKRRPSYERVHGGYRKR